MAIGEVEEVVPLIVQEDHDEQNEYKSRPFSVHPQPSSSRSTAIFVSAALIISLLSVLWNSYNLASNIFASPSRPTSSSSARIDVHALRHPSLYLGLERLPQYVAERKMLEWAQQAIATTSAATTPTATPLPGSHHMHGGTKPAQASPASPANSLSGGPTQIVRVNSRYPTEVMDQDSWVFLTEDDHAIVTFHVPPRGTQSEKCVFRGTFPTRWDLGNRLLTIERDDGVASSPLVRFTSLSTSNSVPSWTWDTRPSVNTLLGSLKVEFGTNTTSGSFVCPSASQFTVELECVGGGCRLEYDSLNTSPTFGIQLSRL